MYCPPAQRRPRNRQSREEITYEFYATYTDGTKGTVPGMATLDTARIKPMALQIARRENVQCVKVLEITS